MKLQPKLLSVLTTTLLLGGCQTLIPVASNTPESPEPTNADTNPDPRPTLEQQLAAPAITPAYQQFSLDEQQTDPVATEPKPTAGVSQQTKATDDLWQRTRDHFSLDHNLDQPRIEAQLKWYSRHPKYLDRMADRASRYYYYILEQVISRGMPAELALLPIVESAYDPFAYSHGRAAGPWQFIPMTAKRFKLKHSWWYDGRRDIQASTKAALDYLELLNKRFDGDWLLALAAYNAGGGNVSKAIRKNRERNKPTDFWSLKLPKETRAYVPKLLALAKLFDNPQAYGLTLKPLSNQPYFAAVDTGSQIDLAKAAELADISIEELYLLNPGFNQWATDPDGPHQLLVPVDKAEGFRQALASYPEEQRVSWARYKIRSGDSLISIAKRHNTTVDTLRTTNKLRGNLIRVGQMLLIPKASANAGTYAYSQGQRQQQKNQRIALRSGKDKLEYRVRSGDSFWKISRAHSVGVRQLAAWNQMAPGDPLRVGQKLVIWQPAGTVSNTSLAQDSRKVVRKIGYRVRSGDSFARIAGKFNVSLSDIKRWNSKAAKSKYLQPGQLLTLYVDVTQIRN